MTPLVVSLWTTNWSLAPGESLAVPVVPNCCVSLVFETNDAYPDLLTAKIVGPMKTAFQWRIMGRGNTFGVTFAPGGFHPFFGKSVRELLGIALPFNEYYGVEGQRTTDRILLAPSFEERRMLIESFLTSRLPGELPAADKD